ncbi:MAG: reactive intermediate/imine deaminase [Anaerolineae bacterium UTCFX2]|jgi:2-iminobutanoate/2-iminopropanoate deaminase|nr:RidA family protein [Anaerolineae bacterium]MCZ7552759.1 RidA family protein [Anaerolineales bacterium]OQY89721.1 MAG: reactive intermediate/imine deaminase [Anaerolineae bacterium UTCFX2]
MTEKQIVQAEKAPKALGPYNVANRFGELVFASGQLGLDPATGELVAGGVEAETRQALTNLQYVLKAAGSSLNRVLKTTVFLRDMGDFAKMNAIYGEYFNVDFPARSTIQVAALPKGGAVEVEAIAYLAK